MLVFILVLLLIPYVKAENITTTLHLDNCVLDADNNTICNITYLTETKTFTFELKEGESKFINFPFTPKFDAELKNLTKQCYESNNDLKEAISLLLSNQNQSKDYFELYTSCFANLSVLSNIKKEYSNCVENLQNCEETKNNLNSNLQTKTTSLNACIQEKNTCDQKLLSSQNQRWLFALLGAGAVFLFFSYKNKFKNQREPTAPLGPV